MLRPSSDEKIREWQERFREQRESGLSISKWCREHQISSRVFHYWKDRLSPQLALTRSCFAELTPTSKTTKVYIEYKGLRIHFSEGFDGDAFKSCLSALKEWSC